MSRSWMKTPIFVVLATLVAFTAGAQPQAFIENPGSPPTEGGLQDCSEYDGYAQPLDAANFGTARTSDGETAFVVAENVFPDPYDGETDGMRWWGINFDFVATFCTDDDDANTPFDVQFWSGTPDVGTLVAEVNDLVPTIVDTGIPFAATTIREYTADFPSTDITGTDHIAIIRQTGVAGCNWLWVDETLIGSYDDQAWQGGSVPSDHTMCVAFSEPAIPIVEIPTLGEIGLGVLLLALFGAGVFVLRRRQQAA